MGALPIHALLLSRRPRHTGVHLAHNVPSVGRRAPTPPRTSFLKVKTCPGFWRSRQAQDVWGSCATRSPLTPPPHTASAPRTSPHLSSLAMCIAPQCLFAPLFLRPLLALARAEFQTEQTSQHNLIVTRTHRGRLLLADSQREKGPSASSTKHDRVIVYVVILLCSYRSPQEGGRRLVRAAP